LDGGRISRDPATPVLPLFDKKTWAFFSYVSALAGTPTGCNASSFLLQRGRKLSLFITSAVSILGWLVIYLSKTYKNFYGSCFGSRNWLFCRNYFTRNTMHNFDMDKHGYSCSILAVYIFEYTFPFNGLPEDHLLSFDLKDQIKPKVLKRLKRNTSFEELRCRKAMKPFLIMLCFFFFQQCS
ncbi:hypothetical protein TSAR_000561, partial [Trichomalopsis sarcophagae]